MTIETVEMPVYKKAYLIEKIDKLNKKAEKLGCEPMVLTFNDNVPPAKYKTHPITGKELVNPLVIPMCEATVEYEIPMLDGWELVATLDIFPGEGENKVLTSTVPDMVVPDEWKNADSIKCDHCGWTRNRHHSVLLRHESGEYKEVGSTCVKDFFPAHDPRGFMMRASFRFDHLIQSIPNDIDRSYGGRGIDAYGLKEVLTVTAACIDKWGWLSKSKAWELNEKYDANYVATASHVWRNINPDPKDKRRNPGEYVDTIEKDAELADETIAYFENLDPGDNDYLLNCTKLADLGYVPYKFMGVACSMISAYERAEKERVEREEKPESNWVGEVGERLKDIRVKVLFARELETQFGFSTLYIFQDSLGNVYKTFYSGSTWGCDKDDVVLLTGTVKKHDEWKGQKNTMLNRCVAKDAPEETFTTDEFNVN